MNPSDPQSYIERKLYINAARDWCHLRADELPEVSCDGASDQTDGLIRCFLASVGPFDIRVDYDGVTATYGDNSTEIANVSKERFDQQAFFSRLDDVLRKARIGRPTLEELTEGALTEVTLDRYERNGTAREACLAAHGTTCAICGFDFAKTYGPDFAGIIQVHHIIPLHERAGEHVVDPVRDLIPVCPNCHVALHSRPGGTYLPDELRELMR